MTSASTPLALVSGANRGIGLEVVRQLAQQGFQVLLGSCDLAKGEAAAQPLQAAGLPVRAVQLDLRVRYLAPDGSYCELETAENQIVCFSADELVRQSFPQFQLNSFLADPPGFHLVFATNEVQRLYDQALDHGAIALSAPTLRPWGRMEASMRDVNGVLINIVSTHIIRSKRQ